MTIFLLLIFALLLIYKLYLDIKSFSKFNLSLYLFLAFGFILFEIESRGIEAILYLSLLLLFNLLATNYGSKKGIVFSILLLVALPFSKSGILLAQSGFLGIMPSMLKLIENSENKKENKRLEISRDFVHLIIGIAIISFAALLPDPRQLIVALIIMGFILGSYTIISKGKFSRMLYKFERKNTYFGSGAIWLALGALLAMGFIFSRNFLIAVLAAIFIGDPLATIVGVKFGKHRIFYNRKKSVEGSSAYFAAVLAVAYPFIGLYTLPVALIAAFVESWGIKIDDNLMVPIILSILLFLFYI
jgi:dolichol kinase